MDNARRAWQNRDASAVVYLLICAAIGNGCESATAFKGPRGIDVYALDREVPEDRGMDDVLRAAGWWLDHGRWVCGRHPQREPGDG